MPRYQALYTHVLGAGSDHRRHVIRTTGLPRALCQERVVLLDDEPTAPVCRECVLLASTELMLALEMLGFADASIAVARRVSDLSFETKKALTDADQAAGLL
mgnify:CR=1 FL=1